MNLLGTLQRKQTCVCVCVSLEVCRDFLVPVVIIIYVCLDVSVRCLSEFCKQGHLCSRAGASGCVCVPVHWWTVTVLPSPPPLVPFSLPTPHTALPSRDCTNCARTDRLAGQWWLAAAKHRTRVSTPPQCYCCGTSSDVSYFELGSWSQLFLLSPPSFSPPLFFSTVSRVHQD